MRSHSRPLAVYLDRKAVFEVLGGQCECIDEEVCAGDRWDCLEIDHRNGDGWKDKPTGKRSARSGGPEQACRYLIRVGARVFRKSRQLLCANCHKLKTAAAGENVNRGGDNGLPISLPQVEMF